MEKEKFKRYGKNQGRVNLLNALVYLLIICVIGACVAAGYFIGYPMIRKYMDEHTVETESSSSGGNTGNPVSVEGTVSGETGVSEDAAVRSEEIVSGENDSTQMPPAENVPVGNAEAAPNGVVTTVTLSGPPEVSFEGLIDIPVIAANASSTINQAGVDNSPYMLFDKVDETSWQEGVSGYGIGEYVDFKLDKLYKVKYMTFKLSNWKSADYYFGNGRPKLLNITLGSFSGPVAFRDAWEEQWVEFSEPVPADAVRIVIEEVYPGTIWEDTCISEIHVYGYE